MSDKKDEPIVLNASLNCICGRRIPWHLAEVGLKIHNCTALERGKSFGCGRSWKFSSDGKTATEVTGCD